MLNPKPELGILWGIGVGPGAPDLLTLRALDKVRSIEVLAVPRPNPWSKSLAWRIIEPHMQDVVDQVRLFLTFPMSKDPEVLKPAWDIAFAAIREQLLAGRDVGFITQGDPLFFSTFIYLRQAMIEQIEGLDIRVIPGVSCISAVPAAANWALADGQERVAILPATYGVEDLRKVVREFDSVVLMKVSSQMERVIELLKEEDLIDKAVYVERASSEDERVIYDLESLTGEKCVYFSTVLICKKTRNGLLQGKLLKPAHLEASPAASLAQEVYR